MVCGTEGRHGLFGLNSFCRKGNISRLDGDLRNVETGNGKVMAENGGRTGGMAGSFNPIMSSHSRRVVQTGTNGCLLCPLVG